MSILLLILLKVLKNESLSGNCHQSRSTFKDCFGNGEMINAPYPTFSISSIISVIDLLQMYDLRT